MPQLSADHIVFGLYLITVAIVGLAASRRHQQDSEDYFLASRSLTWWVIGGSLIAANISTHHFIGMAGQGYSIGLAIASYEWLAAVALILYGKFFLPYYLRTRITTMPEFLERRFDGRVRVVFAAVTLVGYVFIELAVVLYTGALAVESIFGLPLIWGLLILCVIGGGYTLLGGLRAIAYTDVLQVSVLVAGGLTVTVIGLLKVGGFSALMAGAPEKFHMVQPWNHPETPWIGTFFGGLWLAGIFYWGCNQFITQRTLAARNIWHGQMGVVFAGFLKLLVPVLVVLPGIIAHRLYNAGDGLLRSEYVLAKADLAFPTLVKQLLPAGLGGLVMAGLIGAVMSHIASLLVSSSSIITFDVYQRHFRPNADGAQLVRFGRWIVIAVLLIATVAGTFLTDLPAIFTFIQKYWSFLYPGIAAVFLAGFFYRPANAIGSLAALIGGPLWASFLAVLEAAEVIPAIPFLNRAGIDFLVCCFLIWILRTRTTPLPASTVVDRTFGPDEVALIRSIPWYRSFPFWSAVLLAVLVALYVRFF
jgi:SSS family solute:Na+ symporter